MELWKDAGMGYHISCHFAPSYLSRATMAAGERATMADARKCSKYSALTSLCLKPLKPQVIEASGAIGPKSVLFFKDLGEMSEERVR